MQQCLVYRARPLQPESEPVGSNPDVNKFGKNASSPIPNPSIHNHNHNASLPNHNPTPDLSSKLISVCSALILYTSLPNPYVPYDTPSYAILILNLTLPLTLLTLTLKDSFGHDIEDIFEAFEPVPVASGSVAQA